MVQTKIKHFVRLPRVLAFCALSFLIFLSMTHPLNAQAVSQGYGSDTQLQRGLLVKVKKNDPTKVEPASQQSAEELHGVVVDPNDAPVTLSNDAQKVFVATSGKYDVLVSNQNGPVNTGDYVAISALDGVGMKAGTTEAVVIGKALTTFDGKNPLSSVAVKDSEGNSKEVVLGRVQVDIGVARNPLLKAVEPNMPEFLKKATESIAGKEVSPARAYLSIVIFFITTILAASLLIGGVRSALISIGRNPLGKKAIIRGMIQVIMVGITVFITGIFGVYLLLKL